jgi:hypothetical protein
MSRILLLGEYPPLLQSRSALLRSIEANTCAATIDDFARLGVERFDVLILCHTVPQPDRLALADGARRKWPGIRVVQVLKSEFEQDRTLRYADGVVLSSDPAGLLISAADLGCRSGDMAFLHPLRSAS